MTLIQQQLLAHEAQRVDVLAHCSCTPVTVQASVESSHERFSYAFTVWSHWKLASVSMLTVRPIVHCCVPTSLREEHVSVVYCAGVVSVFVVHWVLLPVPPLMPID